MLPYLGFAPNTVNRILVWGLFGIGFDILFGFTGLLSFGQSAFYGTGGFVAAYLLTRAGFPNVRAGAGHRHDRGGGGRLSGRPDRAAAHRHLFRHDHGGDRRGVLLRRVQSAVGLDRRRERPARRADAELQSRLHHASISPPAGRSISSSRSATSSASSSRCASCARRSARSSARSATTRCAPRRSATTSTATSSTAFVIAAAYAGLRRRPARRDAGLHAARRLHVRHLRPARDADRDRRHAARCSARCVGAAVWLFLQDFLQAALGLGAAWKLVLGVVFVLLVCFLRRGIIGGIADLYGSLPASARSRAAKSRPSRAGRQRRRPSRSRARAARRRDAGAPARRRRPCRPDPAGDRPDQALWRPASPTATSTSPSITASCAASSARTAPARSTFFKMLTCEVPPTSGKIVFEGRDITGMNVTDVCQLGLTKSYQVNQLFNRLTVRENLTIAALAELRGKFRLDLFRSIDSIPGLDRAGRAHARAGQSDRRAPTRRCRSSPMARSAGSRSAWRSPPRRACCCSTSRSPA